MAFHHFPFLAFVKFLNVANCISVSGNKIEGGYCKHFEFFFFIT